MAHNFPKQIRTNGGAGLPVFIRDAEDGVDAIQALPADVKHRSHWRAAQEALFAIIEGNPKADTNGAVDIFEAALGKEDWNIKV